MNPEPDTCCGPNPGHPTRLSRRRLLTGTAAGAGLLATWGVGRTMAAGSALEAPAGAAEPADRLEIPAFVPAPPTTVTSTTVTPATTTPTTPTTVSEIPDAPVPAYPFDPPADGEILFPLALGTEWMAYVLENYGDTRGRGNGYYHQGVDIMAEQGTPQVAVVDGELTRRHDDNTFGWSLTGDDGTVYRYFHSASYGNGWQVGDRVRQGDVIGFVSDSGTSAGNFHLHFEYRPDNVPADPYGKLQRVDGATFQV